MNPRVASGTIVQRLILLALLLSSASHAQQSWYVVLGSFADESIASRIEAQLEQQAAQSLTQQSHNGMQRLLDGPYPSRSAAATERDNWRRFVTDAWIWQDQASTIKTVQAPVVTATEVPPATPVKKDTQAVAQDSEDESFFSWREPRDEAPSEPSSLSLVQAIDLATENNPTLQAGAAMVAAGIGQVRAARANLMPQLNLSVDTRRIDRDRAIAGNGRASEQLSSATAGFSQVIYSETAWAGYAAQRLQQKARVFAQDRLFLDIVRSVSQAYFTVLRAQAGVRIREEDLKLAQSNYDRAAIRLRLGVANRSELYRWETDRARARQALNTAKAGLRGSELELIRLLNYRSSDLPPLADISYEHDTLLTTDSSIAKAFSETGGRSVLRKHWLATALERSPALAEIRKQKEAIERTLRATRRSLKIPTLTANGSVVQEMGRDGAGTEELQIDIGRFFPNAPANTQGIGGLTDKTDWAFGFTAQLPVFAGGARFAAIRQQQAQVAQLTANEDATLAAIRSGVLAAAAAAEASFENIEYAETSARAARNNLRLVEVAYERGVVAIIDLLDAQNARTASELAAANAVYDFLDNYFALQRATARFDMLLSESDRTETLNSLKSALAR